MSVHIGELSTEVEVGGGSGADNEPESGWDAAARHRAEEHRASELRRRTASGGFDD